MSRFRALAAGELVKVIIRQPASGTRHQSSQLRRSAGGRLGQLLRL